MVVNMFVSMAMIVFEEWVVLLMEVYTGKG